MNLVKKIYAKNLLTVLDYGAESVIVLVAEKKENGRFQVVGAGDSAAQGVYRGEVTHLGDAAESIVEALKKAESSSGIKIEKLYYNFDNPHLESVFSCGSKLLEGEGEIRGADIEEARKVAERLAGDFEKNILYSKEVQFIIDDHDEVLNPVGVFGKKLDVRVHILRAPSSQCDVWRGLMRRTQLSRCTPVLSAWSTAYGLLPKDDRIKNRLILDLGKDLWTTFVFYNGRIIRYQVKPADRGNSPAWVEPLVPLMKEFLSLDPGIEEVLITGDRAHDPAILNHCGDRISAPYRIASPAGIAKLDYPRYASVAGLLSVADEIESKMPMLRAERGIFLNVKQKAQALINEYF